MVYGLARAATHMIHIAAVCKACLDKFRTARRGQSLLIDARVSLILQIRLCAQLKRRSELFYIAIGQRCGQLRLGIT